ncbi:MAG: 5'-nucleotidase C-terminal domain-containing protein [Coriobacteriia bacterium]|nr:5'-nucleotidase C-terminal domain-containing protein [Coriobacteriia bacterium]
MFGLTTQATAWSVSPSALGDVVFADEVTTAEGQIAELAMQGVDAIVCLAHLGNGPVPCTGLGLAQSLSPDAAFRLTAIIDGHSHTVEDVLVNGVLVVQTGCNLSALGKLTLTFASDGTVSAAEELLDPAAVASQAAPAPDVAADLEAIAATQDEMLSEKLTINPTTLWAGWLDGNDLAAPTRMVETNYGDFVCECFINRASALLAQTGLDDGTPLLAVTNGGGIRAALPRGIVTVRDLVTAFPFSNTVQVKRITPKILRSLFEASFSSMAGQDGQSGMLLQEEISGSFLQLAGFEVTCDPNAPVGQRVKDIYVYGLAGSVDLDDDETPLYLASNSYVMAGGDAYEALADAEMVAEVGGELEAIRSYLDELSDVLGRGIGLRCLPLLAGTKGRLILDGGHEPAPWVATLRLVDAAGEPLPDTDVLLDIDASTCVTTTSDADGYVQVELEDGPHGIAACDPRGFVSFTYEGVDGDGVLGVSYVRQTEASTDLDGLFTSDNVTLPQDVSGARSSSIFVVASAYPNGVTDTLTGQVYAAATPSNDLGIAAMRALMEPATEAYVDNRMGIGLVEDDLRAFPTVTMAPAPEDAEAVWAHIEQMRATLSSELDARGATLDEPLSSAAADAIRATYGA